MLSGKTHEYNQVNQAIKEWLEKHKKGPTEEVPDYVALVRKYQGLMIHAIPAMGVFDKYLRLLSDANHTNRETAAIYIFETLGRDYVAEKKLRSHLFFTQPEPHYDALNKLSTKTLEWMDRGL